MLVLQSLEKSKKCVAMRDGFANLAHDFGALTLRHLNDLALFFPSAAKRRYESRGAEGEPAAVHRASHLHPGTRQGRRGGLEASHPHCRALNLKGKSKPKPRPASKRDREVFPVS